MSTRDEAAGAACARKTNVLSLDTCWKEQRCGSTHELKLREQLVPGGRAWCRWTRGRAREQTEEGGTPMLRLREPRVRVWRASVVSVDTRLKKGKVRNYTQAEAAGATLREQRCRSTRRLKLRQQLVP